MSKPEHRQHPRTRVLLPCTLRLGENEPPIFAVATDLSVGGLFLLEDARLARVDRASVELTLDGNQTVRTEARIVRQQHPEQPRGLDVPGVGLAFVELSPSFAEAIGDLVGKEAA